MGKFIARQILAQKYQVGAHAIIRIAGGNGLIYDWLKKKRVCCR
jgi:hypothetical protein